MKRRGGTIFELVAAMIAIVMAVGTALAVQMSAGKTLRRIESDVNVSQPPAQAMRRICDTVREAAIVTLSTDGKTLFYRLPARSTTDDPITGEKELIFPVVDDGVARSFSVSGDRLVATPGSRVLVESVSATDPLVGSTQYNQPYAVFQSTTIGSRRAITVTMICKETVMGKSRFARMKSTVLIQNSK